MFCESPFIFDDFYLPLLSLSLSTHMQFGPYTACDTTNRYGEEVGALKGLSLGACQVAFVRKDAWQVGEISERAAMCTCIAFRNR